MTVIRPAVPSDSERLLEIYGYYVKNTAISFEYDVPSLDEFKSRIVSITKRYPYLVALCDGKIEGYAYAGVFKNRAAYDRSCETTVYVDKNAQRQGIGKALYAALERELKKIGILNMYACIAYPDKDDEYLTKNSERFHARMGFTKVGEFHKCGYKFGRWYDMIWMEKLIGEHNNETVRTE